MAFVGYARVSTIEQDLSSQLEALKSSGCEEIFSGKQGGISVENEQKLKALLGYVRKGDVVVATKLDRLGRSLKSILGTVDAIHQKGASLKTLDGAIDSTNNSPFSKAMVSLLGVFAELERDLIHQRTSEGRARSKEQGQKFGRKLTIPNEDRVAIRKAIASGNTLYSLAKKYGVSHTTIRRIRDEKSDK